jgi:phage/plasmid-like protein (TIGR03299 family)
MSHEVETLAYVNQVPWHGLGVDLNDLEGPIFGDEFRRLAGLNWELRLDDITTDSGLTVPTHKAVVRVDEDGDLLDDHAMAIVGNAYKIINPAAVFGIPDDLVARGLITYETAGSLMNGRLVFALARLPGTKINRRPEWTARFGESDVVDNFLLWSSRNDGDGCRVAGTTRVRVVCKNTYDAAAGYGFGDRTSIRHRGDVEGRIIEADRIMLGRIKATEEFQRYAQELADTSFSVDAMRTFAGDFLDDLKGSIEAEVDGDEKAIALNDRRLAKRETEIAELVEFFGEGTGNIGTDKADAWNGLTEWLDHQKRRASKAAADQKSREGFFASSIMTGRVMKAKGRALNILRKA